MRKYVAALFMIAFAGCSAGSSPITPSLALENGSAVNRSASRHALRRFAASPIVDIGIPGTAALSSEEASFTVTPPAVRSLPNHIVGTTVDDISHMSALVSSLERLKDPVTRVVFDRQEPASYYAQAIKQFDAVGYTMGELLDSSDIGATSLSSVVKRTRHYLATLGSDVDLWEIGNEVNGEWLGSNVPAKIHEMFTAVEVARGRTVMTLYYEPPQTVTPGYDMIPWEENLANVPADMHARLDYVLVSYYETDNDGIRPTQAQWNVLFAKLAEDFPNAKIGFGEIGMDDAEAPSTLDKAENIMQYYYGLRFPSIPRFIGGDFWWYFAEDCVPTDRPLLTELAGLS